MYVQSSHVLRFLLSKHKLYPSWRWIKGAKIVQHEWHFGFVVFFFFFFMFFVFRLFFLWNFFLFVRACLQVCSGCSCSILFYDFFLFCLAFVCVIILVFFFFFSFFLFFFFFTWLFCPPRNLKFACHFWELSFIWEWFIDIKWTCTWSNE